MPRTCPGCGGALVEAGPCPSCGRSSPSDSKDVTALFSRAQAPAPDARPGSSLAGRTLERFEILELVGRGGMGEVFKARDTNLNRIVAIKTVPDAFANDPERRERFRREAMSASALNHPNICTIYDLASIEGRHFLVMEFVEGRTLEQIASGGPLPVAEVCRIGSQIADALAEAHRHGILHRDIKASNILITPRGQVKVLDFGLARAFERPLDAAGRGPAAAAHHPLAESNFTGLRTVDRSLTAEGAIVGTVHYMSPEQLVGGPLDARSDLFSFGVVLYELAAGALPFSGSTTVAVADAILHKEPDFAAGKVPPRLSPVIRKLLAKSPDDRFATADEVGRELAKVSAPSVPPAPSRRLAAAGGVLVGVVVVGLGAWLLADRARVRWARGTAIPEISRLIEQDKYPEAVALGARARKVLGSDPALEKLLSLATIEIPIETTPPGADVFYRDYRKPDVPWQKIGVSPLSGVRVPKGFYRWKFEKAGFEPAYRIAPTWLALQMATGKMRVPLYPTGSIPPRTIRVPGGRYALTIPGLDHLDPATQGDYLIDEFEVTNADFKKFVDAGGYRRLELWNQAFVRNGRTVPAGEAIESFKDTTGQPGPATWELGTFPKGQEIFPVGGISWYEAAAYAAFAGKSLPTIWDWNKAADTRTSMLVSPVSNFGGRGPVAVGTLPDVNQYGTYDMAGNVKEWCWNEAEGGRRYILGGGWNEPTYMFVDQDAQSPWDRAPSYGVRCVKYLSAPGPTAEAARRVEATVRDYSKEKPVSDEVFQAYRGLYAYDPTPLNAKVEGVDQTTDDWIRQRITMDAAYGNERLIVYLYLPRNSSPPYQTVVYFPGSNAIHMETIGDVPSRYADLVPRSGRALVFPIFKGTYERRDAFNSDYPAPTSFYRDHVIDWAKDMRRSIDYARTRPDLDPEKIAYLGLSWGGAVGPIMVAIEDRFKTAVFLSGGLEFQHAMPEVDQINFVSRVRIPVLMLNGRYDHFFPVETSQVPLFRLLGTPESDKRHVIYDTGHAPPRSDVIRETVGWLDRYLGPVKRRSS